MKKLIVSMMLIISMFAFAAESDPSATVGYVKYDFVGAGRDFVALPMQSTFTTASTLHADLDAVGRYDAALQGWDFATKGGLGWSNDFNLAAGQAYFINAIEASTGGAIIVDGEVVVNPSYNILAGRNALMVPLNKSSMTIASNYETEMGTGSVDAVGKYDGALQGWDFATKGGLGWSNDFAIGIADPHWINATAATTWPGAKSQGGESTFTNASKGDPREVVVRVKDRFDADYDAVTSYGITFKAWFLERPEEVINQDNTWSRVEHYFDLVGACIADLQDFPSPWTTGETLHFLMKDENEGLKAFYEGTVDWVVDNTSGTKVEIGFSDYGFGIGDPILLSEPSSIEGNNVPAETKLHQNYPNPFNPTTTIKFDLVSNSNVKLNVYNYNGQLVRSLVNGQMNSGYHSVNFDASNLSAGVYYYTMETAGKTMTQKMVLVK